MDIFLVELSVVFVLAVAAGIVFRYFGFPSIIGQVLVGILIGVSGAVTPSGVDILKLMGTVGITLLLFLVGLEMNWGDIKKVGWKVEGLFFGQLLTLGAIFTLLTTYFFKLPLMPSVLISISLSFSSTIIVVKALSEKRDINSLYGRINLGVLLLQDILAIVLVVVLPNINSGFDLTNVSLLLLKLFVLFVAVNLVGHELLSFYLKRLVKSGEDMVLVSLAWFVLVMYYAVSVLGLTPEIAGFLAGLSLSSVWGHHMVVSKVKTLRDIFLTMFFVMLGLQIGPGKVDWIVVAGLTLLVVVGKFFVTWIWSRIVGLNGRVSFLVSLSLTQLSEFSLIVMSIGLGYGFWDQSLAKTFTIVGLVTMTISTVLIMFGGRCYKLAIKICEGVFAFKGMGEQRKSELKNHLVLVGCDRTGRSILTHLMKTEENFLVVDFNQDVVDKLNDRGVHAIFSDASDPEMLDLANIKAAKILISTIKDHEDNLILLSEIRERGIGIPLIMDAETPDQAEELYRNGANYVIMPHFVSGWHIGQLMKKFAKDAQVVNRYGKKQKETMKHVYEG